MAPRAFSTEEKKRVRERLIEVARNSLSTTGIRKTTVEDLAKTASISKGAFYQFYESKELLFLDALEEEQQWIHDAIIREIDQHASKSEGFVFAISQMYQEVVKKPWLITLADDEYEILLRRIPKERINEHIALDNASSKRMIDAFGGDTNAEPELVSAVLRALFMSILHRKEIGEYADDAFYFMLQAIASSLFTEEPT